MAAARQPKPSASSAPLTVSQLSQRMGDALHAGFPAPVRVVGEVSGFKPGPHWYFALKDAEALVQCVMFAQAVRAAGFTPANGQQVVVTGRPDYWARGGRASLLITKIEPVGEGAQDAAFQALCRELRGLGWFDDARKRPIPQFPRRIAVITSLKGAALQDVLDTMRRRCCLAEVLLLDVPVQGQGAAEAVTRAVRWVGRVHRREGMDALLVTRGGGSKEDLWAFNDRGLAAAIRESPVPVVAAIGHEVDTTIAELVADLRCATPTQAAMRLTPDSTALLDQLAARANQLRRALGRVVRESAGRADTAGRALARGRAVLVRRAAHRVELAGAALDRVRPSAVLEARRAALDLLGARLQSTIRARLVEPRLAVLTQRLVSGARARLAKRTPTPLAQRLQRALLGRAARSAERVSALGPRLRRAASVVTSGRLDSLSALQARLAGSAPRIVGQGVERLAALERHLHSVGPASVLERGFSYTRREDGRLVRSPSDVHPGDRIVTQVAQGAFGSIVEGSPARKPQRPRQPPPQDTGLFAP